MPITSHVLLMDLLDFELGDIGKMDGLIRGLQANPCFGILYCGGIRLISELEGVYSDSHAYTHGFEMIFCTAAQLAYYNAHEDHIEVVKALGKLGLKFEGEDAVAFNVIDGDYPLGKDAADRYFRTFKRAHDCDINEAVTGILDTEVREAAGK
jgi:hypothetical protein